MTPSALSPAGVAGGGDQLPPPGDLLQVPCDAAMAATGVIGRTVAMHTDADDRLDLIAQVSDALIWVTAPDPLQYSSTLGIDGVSAFAGLERAGATGALIVATEAGLDYVVRDLDQLRIFHPLRTSIGSAAWAGARSLATVDLDGDGDLDIVGLNASGSTLLRLDQVGDAAFEERPSVALGAEMAELRALRWASGDTVLAGILRGATDSVCVFDPSGSLLMAEPFNAAVLDLTVLGDAESAGIDGLAALTHDAVTVLRPGITVEVPVMVAGIAPTAMSAGDVDGDGRVDLLLNSSSSDQVVTLLGQERGHANAPTFAPLSPSTAIVVSLEQGGIAMDEQRANPVAADFDRDGDVDIFQLIEATRGACVQRNAIANEVEQAQVLADSEWYSSPSGTFAFLHVDPRAMGDGALPDAIEVTLATTPLGAAAGSLEDQRTRVMYQLGTASTGLGHELIALEFPGELGATGTLLLRGCRMDLASGAVTETGVDSSYRITLAQNSFARGDKADPVIEPGGPGPQSTPPRPLPDTDPF